MFNKLLNETNEKQILKRSAVLNSIAGVISSTFISILMMMITRTGNIELAGVFSIASVIAYQCLTIGSFATYNVQASDLKREFHLNDFIGLRFVSILLMMILLAWYSFCSGYDIEKAMVVFSFGLFKLSDIVDDLFRAEYHRNKRLDIASLVLIGRYILAFVLFSTTFIFTKNLVFASLFTGLILMVFTLWMHGQFISSFVKEKVVLSFCRFKSLFMVLLPLTVSNYIRMYVVNVPKYAIDMCLSADVQTYYGILVMPAMIINLLAEIIFAPFIPRLAEYWNNSLKKFKTLIVQQLLVILGITLCTIVGGWVIGLDLLSLVYSVDLSNYMLPLVFLLTAGGCNAAALFMTLVLTIQRKQNLTVVVYLLITLGSLFVSKAVVLAYGIYGASMLYLVICTMNLICFSVIAFYEVYKREKVSE